MTETKRKAVFIDRDGTLVEEVNFLSRIEDLRLFPFAAEAIDLLKENDFLVIVITNQSGIGRNLFSEAAMHAIHETIQVALYDQLDGFYFCPHLPDDGCACRKPSPGMLETASRDFEIDLENSWMIGDKTIDIETGINAGTRSALVLTGYGATEKLSRNPDMIAEDLLAAVKRIVEK